jgi:hypothetical protein
VRRRKEEGTPRTQPAGGSEEGRIGGGGHQKRMRQQGRRRPQHKGRDEIAADLGFLWI